MSSWSLKRFTKDMCEEIANNPQRYDSQDLRQAIRCAELHYQDDDYGCDVEWMTNICLKCNDELRNRGERPDW